MELRETLCDGIFKTRDNKFYASQSRRSDKWVVQYLSDDGRYEFVKIYVDDLAGAQQVINQIYDAIAV